MLQSIRQSFKKALVDIALAGLGSRFTTTYPVCVRLVMNGKLVVLDAEYRSLKREVFGFHTTDVTIKIDESENNRRVLTEAGVPLIKPRVYRCTEQLEKSANYHITQYSSQLTQGLV